MSSLMLLPASPPQGWLVSPSATCRCAARPVVRTSADRPKCDEALLREGHAVVRASAFTGALR
eukprot:620498-Alexandrium_andersonii.AAC.1